MKKNPYIYILANKTNRVIYIGATANIEKRLYEHQNKLIPGFTKKYDVTKLVYFESYPTMIEAINREKQLKKWSRRAKNRLISSINLEWENLA
jgi:putative endonuclease